MDDSDKLVLGSALVGGYLLGRTRKARLALVVASCLAGKRLNLTPQDLLTSAVRKLRETPQFAELSDQVREELLTAGRAAADRRLSALADTLAARTAALLESPRAGEEEEEEPEEGEEEPRDEEDEEEGEEEPEEEEPAPRRSSRHRRPAKKAAKKAPAKKAPAKRPPANNPGARKAAALRGQPTRKEPAKPAKKAAKRTTKSTAKRSASRGGRGR
ncbi:hypothetical protein [Streptomyces sp. NRRL F-5630]|uniref:hypothetical protein n=1 Tax=unclassified Streptomyces TaxID=2593676 RepID=UPI0004C79A2A|nr:hypothetical protein [Streptomyces sp. NRRL F-5630]